MRKIIILLFLLLLITCVAGCQSSSQNSADITNEAIFIYDPADANPASDFEYTRNEGGGITISKYIGTDIDVVIPEQIDGQPVTIIGSFAFMCEKDQSPVSVSMPDSITVISTQAFMSCTELTTVRLSQNLQEIHNSAFEKCEKLANISLPDSLTGLGRSAFAYCTSLKRINIPAKTFNQSGFESFVYSGLETIEFEAGVERIPDSAFLGVKIKELILPDSVKKLDFQAFSGCELLEKVSLPEGIETIGSSAFSYCKELEEIIIPQSVKSISESTFGACTNLKKVLFKGDAPAKYTTRETILVSDGNADYTVYYQPDAQGFTTPRWNGYKAAVIGTSPNLIFSGDFEYEVNSDDTITITDYIGSDSEIVIPEKIEGKNVTKIALCAFFNDQTIVSVKMPDTLTEIDLGAFAYCMSLTTVELSTNLKVINPCAFFACSSLEQINLPATLTTLGSEAFSNCVALKSIRIPKSLTDWGVSTFFYTGLQTIELEEGLTSIGNSAFGATKISEIVVPSSVKVIGEAVFRHCNQLQSVILKDGLVSIGDYTFESLSLLKELIIPASVTELTEVAFNCCYGLESLRFEGNAPKSFIHENPEEDARNVHFTVYYHEGAKGFSSSTWCGYPSKIW